MSFECVSQILDSNLTNGTEVAVLVALAHCLNEQTGECFPSTETISRLARRSPLVVRKALSGLPILDTSLRVNPPERNASSLYTSTK